MTAPRPFCGDHTPGTLAACGRCATARRKHEEFLATVKVNPTPGLDEAKVGEAARRAEYREYVEARDAYAARHPRRYARMSARAAASPFCEVGGDRDAVRVESDVVEVRGAYAARHPRGLIRLTAAQRGIELTGNPVSADEQSRDTNQSATAHDDAAQWARVGEFLMGNPLAAADVRRYAALLARLLRALGWEVVETALIGERKADLLSAERQEVDRLRELLDDWILVPLQLDGDRGRALEVLDAFEDEVASAAGHGHSVGGAS